MSAHNGERLSKNERRQQAREQAKAARAAEQKRQKRNKFLLQGAVVVAIIAILAIAALVITNALRPAAPAESPKNMASGGVVFGADLKVTETPKLAADADFVPTEYTTDSRPVHVRVFADFICPACGSFESTYGAMLEQYTGSGDIKLEIAPLNFLDTMSAGSKYSTRAANAFSCVVDEQPEHAYSFFKKLFEVQPAENTTGLTDAEIIENAVEAGVEKTDTFTNCVKERKFAAFIDKATAQVMQTGILGIEDDAVFVADPRTGTMQEEGEPQRLASTPTVIVNGQQWYQPRDGGLEDYLLRILQDIDAAETEG